MWILLCYSMHHIFEEKKEKWKCIQCEKKHSSSIFLVFSLISIGQWFSWHLNQNGIQSFISSKPCTSAHVVNTVSSVLGAVPVGQALAFL